jgi:hypothetical protein
LIVELAKNFVCRLLCGNRLLELRAQVALLGPSRKERGSLLRFEAIAEPKGAGVLRGCFAMGSKCCRTLGSAGSELQDRVAVAGGVRVVREASEILIHG